ncbi:MAG: hypothetical protein QM523_03705 [Candidatus Pacebacteria bacterium]|nr:hypothetical protein [Candidatus Paceibacterota bacterium]
MIEAFVLRKFSDLWNWSVAMRNLLISNGFGEPKLWKGIHQFFIAKWKLWTGVAVFLGLLLVGLSVFAPRFEHRLDPSNITLVSEINQPLYAYPVNDRVSFPWQIRRDNPPRKESSDVTLLMGNLPLNHNPDLYYVLDLSEPGYFAHSGYKGYQSKLNLISKNGLILFTTPDRSDPRKTADQFSYNIKSSVNYFVELTLIVFIALTILPLILIVISKIIGFLINRTANINQNTLFLSIAALSLFSVFLIIMSSFDMRPSRDDIYITNQFKNPDLLTQYVLKPSWKDGNSDMANQVANSGLWEFQIWYWKNWIGTYFGVLLNSIFIGLPMIYLPWHLSSALPFLLTLALISLATTLTIRLFFQLSRLESLMVYLLATIGWWVFLWTRDSMFEPNSSNGHMAYGVITWQNINIGYLMTTSLVLILATTLFGHGFKNKYLNILLAILAGIICGNHSYVVSLSVLLVTILFSVAYYRGMISLKKPDLVYAKFFFFSTLINFIILVSAPGGVKRYNVMREYKSKMAIDETVKTSLLDSVIPVFYDPIKFIFSNIFSLASLYVFLLGMIVGFFYYTKINQRLRPYLFNLLVFLLVFIIASSFAMRLAEFFSYPGYWHYLNYVFLLFVFVLLFGIWSGSHLGLYFNNPHWRAVVFATMTLLMIGAFFVTYNSVVIVKSQHDYWVKGFRNEYIVPGYRNHYPAGYLEENLAYWHHFAKFYPDKAVRY